MSEMSGSKRCVEDNAELVEERISCCAGGGIFSFVCSRYMAQDLLLAV